MKLFLVQFVEISLYMYVIDFKFISLLTLVSLHIQAIRFKHVLLEYKSEWQFNFFSFAFVSEFVTMMTSK